MFAAIPIQTLDNGRMNMSALFAEALTGRPLRLHGVMMLNEPSTICPLWFLSVTAKTPDPPFSTDAKVAVVSPSGVTKAIATGTA